MLVMELDVADEHLVHTRGMAGRQGIQLGLQRKYAGYQEGRRPQCNQAAGTLEPRRKGARTSFSGNGVASSII